MTPERAAELLKLNKFNRRIRSSVVERYAHSIRTGQWKLTQQAIAVGTNNILLDGQHRLAAIVEAGLPAPLVVATECDPEIFSVLDTGAVRLASDALYIEGAVHSVVAAAGLKTYILMNTVPDLVWTGGKFGAPSHAEITEAFRERSDEVSYACTLASSVYKACRHTNKPALMAFVLLCLDAGWSIDWIEEFCTKLGNGVGLDDTSPILKLRAALINGVVFAKSSRTYAPQVHLSALIKAFNYWTEGASLRLFKLPSIPPMPTVARASND